MKCRHESCDCELPLEEEERFCGSHCKDAIAFEKREETCRCGHPGCGDAVDRDDQPDEPHSTVRPSPTV